MKILAWETATEQLSVALWLDGAVSERALPAERGGAEQLLAVMRQLLAEAGLGLSQLDLLAVGRGPGGFTGVRLGISVAQGLGFSTGLPVVPVSTLQAVAQDAWQRERTLCEHAGGRIQVCQDARMAEIYSARFVAGGETVVAEGIEVLGGAGSIMAPGAWTSAGFVVCGSALAPFPSLAQLPGATGSLQLAAARPGAGAVARLAAHAGAAAAVAAAQVLPVYLRNDVAVPSIRH